MTPHERLLALERDFPHIKWRTPIIAHDRFGCRICVAQTGRRGNQEQLWPETYGAWERHFVTCHLSGTQK